MPDPDLRGPIEYDAGPPVRIRLSGDIDFVWCPKLRRVLEEAARTGGDIGVDVSDLAFIDSSGIGTLLEFAQSLVPKDRHVVLHSPRRSLVRILKLAGLSRYFRWDNPEAAVATPPPRPPRGASWQHSAFTLPCRTELLSMGRERVLALARALTFTLEDLDDIELAIGEALSNALRHGCTGPDSRIAVDCEANEEGLTIRVTDPGGGFDPHAVPLPAPGILQEGGMGLYFMRMTMDEVHYTFDDRGTTVTLVKRLHRPAA